MTITPRIIERIREAGFTAYMRDRDDTYLYFTDGTRIGYLQNNRWSGLSLTTVHVPNTTTGTGFGVAEHLSEEDLTREVLERAFAFTPAWAPTRDLASRRKWKDFAEFQRSSTFNAAYKPVEA